MTFQKESDFEEALIKILTTKGWESTILKYPTEQDLIRNWANILFDNNRGIDRLGDYPLTDGEMQQIVEQIRELRTPLKLNGFINGKTVSVKRDNSDDKAHFGKEVSLKIYDRMEIAAGQSRYQIVQQPIFPGKSKLLNDRRGDLMLLINGMPVFHLELKRSGVPVSQAYNQIEKYAHEGVFTGLFSLVQIFVAMNPEETVYFANPGPDGSGRQAIPPRPGQNQPFALAKGAGSAKILAHARQVAPLHAHRAPCPQTARPVLTLRREAVPRVQRRRQVILGKGKLLQTPVPQSADVARPVEPRRKSQGRVARSHTLQGQAAP